MKKPLAVISSTFCYVSLLVLLGITAIYYNAFNGFIPISFLWYSMSIGAVSGIISCIFFTENVIKSCPQPLRFTFFFVCLVSYVALASYLFGIVDFSELWQVLTMLVMIGIIFAVVWFAQLLIYKQQEKELTDKLREFNESFDD